MVQVNLTLPRHHAENVEREQHARRMQFAVSLIEEAGDYVIAMNFGVRLKRKLRVCLVALGREAHVVEVNLAPSGLSNILGEGKIVRLDVRVRRIRPYQLSVFAPRLMQLARLDGESAVVPGNVVVAEKRLARDDMHVERVEEAYVLWQVRDRITLQLARQRMIERNINGPVTIFHFEDHTLTAPLMPAAHQFNAARTARAGAGEIDRADFTIFGKWPALFHDRLWFDSGNQDA